MEKKIITYYMIILIIASILLILNSSINTVSASQTNIIVKAYDKNGNPLAGARVIVYSETWNRSLGAGDLNASGIYEDYISYHPKEIHNITVAVIGNKTFLYKTGIQFDPNTINIIVLNATDENTVEITIDAYTFDDNHIYYARILMVLMNITDKYGNHPIGYDVSASWNYEFNCIVIETLDLPVTITVTPGEYGILFGTEVLYIGNVGHSYALYKIMNITENTELTFKPKLNELSIINLVYHPTENETLIYYDSYCESWWLMNLSPYELGNLDLRVSGGIKNETWNKLYMYVTPGIWNPGFEFHDFRIEDMKYCLELRAGTLAVNVSKPRLNATVHCGGHLNLTVSVSKKYCDPGDWIYFKWNLTDSYGWMVTSLWRKNETSGIAGTVEGELKVYDPNGTVILQRNLYASGTWRKK